AQTPRWPDRMPFLTAVERVCALGYWPDVERRAKAHGLHSREVYQFVWTHHPRATCVVCGAQFLTRGARMHYCSPRCNDRAEREAARERGWRRAKHPADDPVPCARCGQPTTSRYCSQECSLEALIERNRAKAAARPRRMCDLCGRTLRPGQDRYCCPDHAREAARAFWRQAKAARGSAQ